MKPMTIKELVTKAGKARWRGVSKAARSEHGRRAALIRWGKKKPS